MNVCKAFYYFIFTAAGRKVLQKERDKERQREMESRRYNLQLCYDHRQEQYHSHYSPQNCDYCKLLKENHELRAGLRLMKEGADNDHT